MRYLKYIFLSLISCILTMSCVKELDAPFYGDEVLTTLVPRVKSFTNQYVTKAYSGDEAAINSLSALIFDNDGKFVDIQSGTTSVTINKCKTASWTPAIWSVNAALRFWQKIPRRTGTA